MALALQFGGRPLLFSSLLKRPAPTRVPVAVAPAVAQPVPVRVITSIAPRPQLVPDAGVPRTLPLIAPRIDEPVIKALPAPVTVSTPRSESPSSCGGCMPEEPSAIPPAVAVAPAPVVTAPNAPPIPAGTPATLPNQKRGGSIGMALFALLLIVGGGLALAAAVRPR